MRLLIFTFLLILSFTLPALEIIIGLPYGKHNIGHSTVRINTYDKDKEIIFDFGRYGRTWGYLNFKGEGIMRVWKGEKAVRHFISKQRRFRNSIGFEIKVTPKQEKKILAYYKKMIHEATPVAEFPNHKRYRLRRNFDGVTTQCTAMALEGLEYVLPQDIYHKLVSPSFNRGEGFTKKQRNYFFKIQKSHGINKTVVPLDVKQALDHAVKNQHPMILRKNHYKRRRREVTVR